MRSLELALNCSCYASRVVYLSFCLLFTGTKKEKYVGEVEARFRVMHTRGMIINDDGNSSHRRNRKCEM